MRDPQYLLDDVRRLTFAILDPANGEGTFYERALAHACRDLDNALCEGGALPDEWRGAKHQGQPLRANERNRA